MQTRTQIALLTGLKVLALFKLKYKLHCSPDYKFYIVAIILT